MSYDPEAELGDLLLEALALEDASRQEFLARKEPAVRDELLALMESYSEASGFFGALAENLQLPGAANVQTALNSGHNLTGQQFGHYRLGEVIGGGGMGVVYRAEDVRLRRQAAVKILPDAVSNDPRARQRFMQEARAASALDHPNICTIYEVNEADDGRIYLAMALYEGRTLRQAIEDGPLPADRAVEIAEAVAEGLAAAHARGIAHRDIKPDNVFLTSDGGIRILDFGLAKTKDAALVTREGATVGTAAYMSPEQAQGREVDHRTDIWSLGVILYEMLTGRRPFPGHYQQAIVYGIVNAQPEPIAVVAPHVPLQLASVVERAMEKNHGRRFSSCTEVLEQLRGAGARQAAIEEAREILFASEPTEGSGVDKDVLNVLCVDDEPELELLMQQRFRRRIRAGEWKFTFALNGVEALEALQRNPDIGLILTDLNMPRMDGLTLLGELADVKRPLRTVVVSAYGDMERIRTAMNRGAFDFVTKPIDFKDLEITVQKAAADLQVLTDALRSQREMASIQQERDVARRIQEAVMPTGFPESEDVEVYGFSAPARDVSGTFLDTIDLGESLALVQGDVSGRGVSSALLVAMAQTLLRGFLQRGMAPSTALRELNAIPIADGLPHLELQAFVAVLNKRTGHLVYANAAHAQPFIRKADGDVGALDVTGESLWAGHAVATDLETKLEPGDLLVAWSAGVAGARSADGKTLTSESLASKVRGLSDTSPKRAIRDVVRCVYRHLGDADPADDLTLLAVRRS